MLALDGLRHLRGHELEDVALALPVAHPLGIGLCREHADGLVAQLEWHPDPIQRRGADQLDLAAALHLTIHPRRGE